MEKNVKCLLPIVVLIALVSPAFSQESQLPVSSKYPLQANIVSVETQQRQDLTNGTGETSITHLVRAEIAGKTYRLSVKLSLHQKRPFQHRSWLQPGLYPARRTSGGFEV